MGPDAYRFVDFLQRSGFTVWQTLPIGPTDGSFSPYSCQSIYAGNPDLISLDLLVERGWLASDSGTPGPETATEYRRARLAEARREFLATATQEEHDEYAVFKQEREYWLENHAMFRAIKEAQGDAKWWEWPHGLRDRAGESLDTIRVQLAEPIEQHKFEQFLFFRQWLALKKYANERGIMLFGDMPVFVAEDSVTTWARRHFFRLNSQGRPEVVAGVPPDYFSATGQRWGNPHYDWERMRQDDFHWWRERVRNQLNLFDYVRVDHFRGFEAYWEIDGKADTAMDGQWVKAPGVALFEALCEEFPSLPFIAEDLGIITSEVVELRDRFGFPGMKVLQFAFDGGPENPYLPHNHVPNCVVYAGTHDNNTTVGWFETLTPAERAHVCDYLGCSGTSMPWPVLRAALASVAQLAVLTMQDVLGLGAKHRMNMPGIAEGNWQWRFTWEQIKPGMEEELREMVRLYGRE